MLRARQRVKRGWKVAAGAVLAFVTRRVNPGSVAVFVWRARAPPSCLRKGNVFSGERRENVCN